MAIEQMEQQGVGGEGAKPPRLPLDCAVSIKFGGEEWRCLS